MRGRLPNIPIPIPYMAEGTREGDKPLLGALMLAHAAVFMAMPPALKSALALWPTSAKWYAPVTSLFVQYNGAHLAMTLWPFWLFGGIVSGAAGFWFFPLYLACGVAGALAHLGAAASLGATAPAVGAQGAVAGLVAAAVVLDPRARLQCLSTVSTGYRSSAGVSFSVSALLFAVIYIPVLALFASGGGPSAWSVLGGGAFGLVAAVFLKFTAASGAVPAPAAVLAAVSSRAAIEDAIRGNREGEALQGFIDALRRDPGFELSANAQLWAADKLARAGHPHMARTALKRFIARHEADPLAAHAYLLSGFVHQSYLGDLESAVAAYKRAALHPAAPAAVRADADKRLSAADALLKRTFVEAPREGETYAVVMEGVIDPNEEHAKIIAAAAGDKPENVDARLAKAPGFILRWMGAREAGELAETLEAAELPVVVVAESTVPRLAVPKAVGAPEAGGAGLRLKAAGGEELTVPWSDCLLIAAGGVGMPKSTEKQRGLFDITDIVVAGRYGRGRYGRTYRGSDSIYVNQGGPRAEYEAGVVHVPLIDIVTHGGTRRWRYTPCPDLTVDGAAVQAFFDVLQALVTGAPSIPTERGALAAFDRKIPEDCLHSGVEAWDGYLTWQTQLALLKQPRP